MPRIPGPSDVGSKRAARPQNIRNIGAEQQAQAEVGETIVNVADQLRRRRQEAEDTGFLAQIASQASPRFTQVFQEQQEQATRGEFASSMDERLAKESEQLIEGAREQGFRPSSSAINQAQLQLSRKRGQFGVKAATFENNARIERLTNSLESSISGFGVSAFNEPDTWQEQLAQSRELIEGSGGLVDDIDQKKRDARSSITEAAVNGLINTDPQEAINRLDEGVYDAGLNADSKDSLRDSAGVALRRQQAEQRRQQRENRSRIQSQVRAGLKDEEASINRTGERAGVVSDTMIRAAFPDTSDQIIETLHDQQEFYTVRQQTALSTPEEDEEILQSIQPEGEGFAAEAKRQDILTKTLRQKYKALGIGTEQPGDPVQYLVSTSPEIADGLGSDDPRIVQQSMSRLLDEQERLGVPESRKRVLSDVQAENITGEIQTADEPAQQMAQLQETFGPHFDQAYSEMVKAGLPAEMVVLGSVADDPIVAQQLSELMKTDERELKSGLETTDIKTIRTSVGDQLNDFFQTVEAGDFTGSAVDLTAKYRSVIEKMAIQNFRRSGDIDQAVSRAANRVILDRYEVLKSGDAPEGKGFAAYMPTHIDGVEIAPAKVERLASQSQTREAIEGFNPAPIEDPTRRPTMENVFIAGDRPEEMSERGNIDLTDRPIVRNDDGTISTVRSITITVDDGKGIVLPTVSDDGRIMTEDEAVRQFRETGRHLGVFNNLDSANRYSQRLHEQQDEFFGDRQDFVDKERIIRTAVNSGFWVTDETGKGMVLMVPFAGGGALPLVNEDGERYSLDFKEAMRADVSIGAIRFPGLETGVKPR